MNEEKIIKIKINTNPPIELEGTWETIEEVLDKIGLKPSRLLNKKGKKESIRELIIKLIEEGFFLSPKTLTEIGEELNRKGYNYPSSSIFPVLQRNFLRKDILQRNGSKRNYRYFIELEE